MYGTCDLYSVNLLPNFFSNLFSLNLGAIIQYVVKTIAIKNWSAVQTGVVQVVNAKDAYMGCLINLNKPKVGKSGKFGTLFWARDIHPNAPDCNSAPASILAQTSNIHEQAYKVHIKKKDVPDASQIKISVGVQKKNNKNNCIDASKAKTVGASVFEYSFGEK